MQVFVKECCEGYCEKMVIGHWSSVSVVGEVRF